MEGANPYLELLKEELVSACAVINPSLTLLRELNESDFESIKTIIERKLEEPLKAYSKGGVIYTNTTITIITLKRLFRYGYSQNFGDKRVMNTLNKFSAFLDYPDWNTFTEKKRAQYNLTNRSIEEELVRVIENANNAEFKAYQALPEIETGELLKYLTPTGSAFMRIYNILLQHSPKQWTISNAGNPSGYKMSKKKIRIESMSSVEAIVKTFEYWYLRWFEVQAQRYCHIYNEKNVQTWTLVFEKGAWKVSDTYYPSPKNSVHITHVIIASLSRRFRWVK